MVKREPNLLWSRLIVLFWIFFAVTYLGYIPFQMEPRNRLFAFVVSFFVAATNFVNAMRVERYWRRQQQRRECAAQGDAELLAEQQPPAHFATLQLPLTITLRIPKRWNIVCQVSLVLFLAILIPIFIFAILQTKSLADLVAGLLIFVAVIIMLSLFFAVPFLQSYQRLTVDDDGIHVRVGIGRRGRDNRAICK